MLRRHFLKLPSRTSLSACCFHIHPQQQQQHRHIFGGSGAVGGGPRLHDHPAHYYAAPPPPPPSPFGEDPAYQNYYQHQQQQQQQYNAQHQQSQYHQSQSGFSGNNSNASANRRSFMFKLAPMLMLSGFTITFTLNKLEEVFVSPCNRMADTLLEGGAVVISMADTPIYHDAMFRESICLATYIGPSGTEALIINKPIHDSDFEKELRYYKFKKNQTFSAFSSTPNRKDDEDQASSTDDENKQNAGTTTLSAEVQGVLDDLNEQKRKELLLEQSTDKSNRIINATDDNNTGENPELHSIIENLNQVRSEKSNNSNLERSPLSSSASNNAATDVVNKKPNSSVLRASSLPSSSTHSSTLLNNAIFQNELANNPVFCGGPMGVDENSVKLLHSVSNLKGAVKVAPGLFLGGDLDQLRRAIQLGKTKSEDVMVIVGYSSWGPGQLYSEWRRGGWDFFVAGKNETNLQNVCRKINVRASTLSSNKDESPATEASGNDENVSAEEQKTDKKKTLDKMALYQAMRQMYEDDVMKRAARTFDNDETKSEENQKNAANNGKNKKVTKDGFLSEFATSLFYTRHEYDVSSSLWKDHLKCFENPKETKLSGQCVVTNLKKVSYFGNLTDKNVQQK